ncbi:hypothetical protein DL98DRAFT_254671 [Cadophora sp. DSE1049]|nr:hypothetical protein DL98DRAFT_254671 [Cadophora sp. DSE1049]
MLALSRLGIVDKGNAADPALLVKVTRWCASLVPVLEEELGDLGIEKGANKWFDIENLIRAECHYESEDGEIDEEEEPEPDDQASGLSNQVAVSAAKLPSPSVMNLLLTLVYAGMGSYAAQFSAACPDCPANSPFNLLKALDEIPTIKDRQHLKAPCPQSTAKQNRVISWLSSVFGSDIIEATSESGLKIPGFPNSAPQFVLAKAASTHRDVFAKHLKKAKGKSMLLFHGTPLRHLQSILRNGFTPAGDRRFGAGLFTAEEPATSYYYATKEAALEVDDTCGDYWKNFLETIGKSWPHTPYKARGALLGCEVTGKGRPTKSPAEPGVHVITQLESIMIRHIILIPANLNAMGVAFAPGAPTGAAVEPAMTAVFKLIHNGIIPAASGTGQGDGKVERVAEEEGEEEGESSRS